LKEEGNSINSQDADKGEKGGKIVTRGIFFNIKLFLKM
jgi:hypothetical protein